MVQPLDPTELLLALQLTGSKGRRTVTARVADVRRGKHYDFITLHGEKHTLNCRVPKDLTPPLDSDVVVSGTLTVKLPEVKSIPGFEVLLVADEVTVHREKQTIKLERHTAKTSLENFLKKNALQALLVIATGQVGYPDLQREFSKVSRRTIKKHLVNMQNMDAIVEAVQWAKTRGYKAVLFAKGGGDRAGMLIWDNPELIERLLAEGITLYTALGHAKDRFLIDEVADESFATPTAAGAALGRAVRPDLTVKPLHIFLLLVLVAVILVLVFFGRELGR